MTLGMTYRYIYLLLHSANNMVMSRQSRVVGKLTAMYNLLCKLCGSRNCAIVLRIDSPAAKNGALPSPRS
jgi:hypothetical protein